MWPNDLLLEPAWQRLAVVLMHFLWQGALVAAVYGVAVEWFLRRPQQRYTAGVLALAVMGACLPMTYGLAAPPPSPAAASTLQSVVAPISSPTMPDQIPRAGQPANKPPLLPELNANDSATVVSPAAYVEPEPMWRAELYRRIVAVWLLGVAMFSLRLLSGAVGLRLLTAGTTRAGDELWKVLQQLGSQMRFGRLPRLVISHRVAEAIAAGFFRPVIVLPAAWLSELPPDVIEAVLAHELAHIRRYDLWVNLLQRAVEAVLFFHPAVWWVSRQVRSDREMCCDELAVAATGQKVAYVSALEAVARRAAREPLFSLATGIGGRKMQLLERVRYVLGLPPQQQRAGGWWAAGVLALAVPCGLWALTGPSTPRALAQDEPAEREREREDREDERDERDDRDDDREDRADDRDERERDRPARDREARGDRPRDRGDRSPEARAAREERREAERRRDRELRDRGNRPREERDVEVELEFRGDRPGPRLERRAEAEAQRQRAEQLAKEAVAREQKVRAELQRARAEIERAHAETQRRMAEAERKMSQEMRQAAERGEDQKVEALKRELEAMRLNAEEQVRQLEERMRNSDRVPQARRNESETRRTVFLNPQQRQEWENQREMIQVLRELRSEVQELRREVRGLRERGSFPEKDRPQAERRKEKESAKIPILGDVPLVGKLFRNEEVEEVEVEVKNDDLEKLDDVEIEFSNDQLKLDGVKLNLNKRPVKIDGGKLTIIKEPVKIDGAKLEITKHPAKLDGVKVEFENDAVKKLNEGKLEFKNVPVEKLKDIQVELKSEKLGDLKAELKKEPLEELKQVTIELKQDVAEKEKLLMHDLQALKQQAADNVDLRYAEKAAELAKIELQKAIEANQKTPGAVSDLELEQLKLTLQRGLLEIERAKGEQHVRLLQLKKALEAQASKVPPEGEKASEPAKK